MSKDPRSIYKEGDVLVLKMMRPKSGVLPIAKTEEGIVCRLFISKSRQDNRWIKVGTRWRCSVMSVEAKKLIILPIEEVDDRSVVKQPNVKSTTVKRKTILARVGDWLCGL